MTLNAHVSEEASVLAAIDPTSQAAGAANSGWVDAAQFHRFLAIVEGGVVGSSATIDAKLQQASDSSGTGAKDITGKTITQIVANNKKALIDLRPEELDLANGFTFFRLVVTVGTAASLTSGTVLGFNPRNGVGADYNVAAVTSVTQ